MFDKRAAVSCECQSLVVELWCCWATPTAFPCGHRCTVGTDWDPPMCPDAQGGIRAKRQTFRGWNCLEVMCLGRGRRHVLPRTFCQMLELRILTHCSTGSAAHKLSVQDSRFTFPCERLRSQSLQTFSCRDLQCCAPRGSCLSSPLYCAPWQV